MAIARDRALVLRRTPFGESSLVVHALTREHGRVHLLAKGAYRPTSGYYAVLDLFDSLELEWSSSERAELALLRRGALVARRRAIAGELARYRAALSMLELVETTVPAGSPEADLYAWLEAGLEAAASAEVEPLLALVVFELGFLRWAGIAPALESCASCGAPGGSARAPRGGARVAFSAEMGGRLCGRCAASARRAGRRVGTLPEDVLAAAARLARLPLGDALARVGSRALPDPAALLQKVHVFDLRFLAYHLDAPARARSSAT